MTLVPLLGRTLAYVLVVLVACGRETTPTQTRTQTADPQHQASTGSNTAPRSEVPAIRSELKHGQSTRVIADDQRVTLEVPGQSAETMRWSDVKRVSIVTTDEGPRVTDVFIALDGPASRLLIPQDARGNESFIDLLLALEGFDLIAFVEAMGSAENAQFVCWTGTTARFRKPTK